MFSDLKIDHLKCEYCNNPLGLDIKIPRLSWLLVSKQRCRKQTAYQILVSSSEDGLLQNNADIWDSGKVTSDRNVHIEYAGPSLSSRRRYFWKVRIWDQDNCVSHWSQPAWWEMGLLDRKDWAAQWIQTFYNVPVGHPDSLPMLRKEFNLDAEIVRARVYACAMGVYDLRINGRRVSDDRLAPGWTDYHKRILYQTYDVTELIQKGGNAIGVVCGEGWYCGRVGFFQGRANYGHFPRFIMQMEITTVDGRVTIISDTSWKQFTDGPLRSSCLLDGECYDARMEIEKWDMPGFDDSTWEAVVCMGWTGAKLTSQYNEPIRVTNQLAPIKITKIAPDVLIYDFGQNIAGCCRLNIKGVKGQKIQLKHAEMLEPDGRLYTAGLRDGVDAGPPKGILKGAAQTDTYILRGDSQGEVFEPRFTCHGFRYVEVTGLLSKPSLDCTTLYKVDKKDLGNGTFDEASYMQSLTALAFHSDVPVSGKFQSSWSVLNKLMDSISWTIQNNMQSIPTDCPQRDERLGWLGDAGMISQTACFTLEMTRFLTKYIQDIRDDQWENGHYTDFVPMVEKGRCCGSPGAADYGVEIPWRMYENYSDIRIIQQHYDSAKRYVDHIRRRNPDLIWKNDIGKGITDWLNGDTLNIDNWPHGKATLPYDVFATAFFAHSSKLLAKMASVLELTEDHKQYTALFENIKNVFRENFVDHQLRIKGDTQAGYVLALSFELFEPCEIPKAVDNLISTLKEYDWRLSTGFQATYRMMKVLSENGHTDIAYRLLNNKSCPSWQFMLDNGATTIWEHWDSFVPKRGFADAEMNSFCHTPFAAVGEWVWRHIAGLNPDPDNPGYKKFALYPKPGGGLKHVKAEYDSIHGKIMSEWELSDDVFTLKIQIPPNTSARVYVLADQPDQIKESGKSAKSSSGIEYVGIDNDFVVYDVGSGQYSFMSPLRNDFSGKK